MFRVVVKSLLAEIENFYAFHCFIVHLVNAIQVISNNFKRQYLRNYTSLTNDLYSVRKKSIRAFKSIFKLLCWGPASAGPSRANFFARSPEPVREEAISTFKFIFELAPDFASKLCTRDVSGLAAVQFVSKHARAPLT